MAAYVNCQDVDKVDNKQRVFSNLCKMMTQFREI